MRTRTLTVKQRKFIRGYLETGNGTEAAMQAYDTSDRGTAHAIASENLRKRPIQDALAALLDAGGISDRKLFEIHAHYLAMYNSPDVREKALGLKALDMAYKLIGAYGMDPTARQNDIIGQMSDDELVAFVERREVPERLAEYFPGGRLLLPHDA